jgi:group I intron endonuclease
MKPIICGIYAIVNRCNGKFYIGSSSNIDLRWIDHRCRLKHGKHPNRILQSAWDKYGADCFEFLVIEHCNKSELIKREQYYIDQLMPQYNISREAGSPPALAYSRICDQCGREYIAKNISRRFCSNRCRSKWRRNSGVDNVSRKCVICGGTFVASKYSDSKTCSNVCRGKLLWKNISAGSKNTHREKVSKARLRFYENGGQAPHRRSVEQYSVSGALIGKYKSATDAALAVGIDISGVARCARGAQKTAGGFIWRYVDRGQ